MVPQRPSEEHMSGETPSILVWRVPVLENSLHELVIVEAHTPGYTVFKHPLGRIDCGFSSAVTVVEVCAAWPVRDVPVFYLFLEDATHHLWPSIHGDVFRYVPRGTEVSHDGD